ncbi:type II toxin-antitoxin system HigB family toxin [Pseudomonas putida]|uniref:type II toxin-antitoxin system HigB family toxin n=1 Tax=Pseudomonas putida TaxID=303 RepID=UPI003FD58E5E
MKLLGIPKLALVKGESDLIDKWVSSWVSEMTHANWKNPENLTEHFPAVVITEDESYLFSVLETGIVIKLQIAFAQGIAIITELTKKS